MRKELLKKMVDIEPYVPGEQPNIEGMIKLNTNECPYPPSPRVAEALKRIDAGKLDLYPDFVCRELREIISENYPVSPDEIFPGNGSDEVLALCFKAFFNSDKPVLFPDITYSFYTVWAELFKIPYKLIPLNEDFTINVNRFSGDNGGIVIPNPNAPTGIALSRSAIEEIIKNNKNSIVIIDEAYVDFSEEGSIAELIHKYDNLVVVQTYSKSRALAGIRFGYAFANKELIQVLEGVKNSFNSYTVNTVTRILAEESGKDMGYFEICVDRIKRTRARLIEGLDELGFVTLPSSANFVFTKKPGTDGGAIFEYLRSKKIYVRHFDKPKIRDFLRITIGTDREIDTLLDALREFSDK